MKTILLEASEHLSQGDGLKVGELEPTPTHQAAAQAEVPAPGRSRFPGDISARILGTILVPVDFTAVSLKALDHALLLAKQAEASIVLLHVLDSFYTRAFINLATRQKVRREAHRGALQMIQEFAEPRMDQGVPINCVVRDGVPNYEILRFAETEDVNLIVLGRQLRNPLRRLLVGSVGDDVADLSPCPVLVVNGRASTRRWQVVVAKEGIGIVPDSRWITLGNPESSETFLTQPVRQTTKKVHV